MKIALDTNRVAEAIARSGFDYAQVDERAGRADGWLSCLVFRVRSGAPIHAVTAGRLARALNCDVRSLMPESEDIERIAS